MLAQQKIEEAQRWVEIINTSKQAPMAYEMSLLSMTQTELAMTDSLLAEL